jgi:LysM repeat protein
MRARPLPPVRFLWLLLTLAFAWAAPLTLIAKPAAPKSAKVGKASSKAGKKPAAPRKGAGQGGGGTNLTHTIKAGDSLWTISKKYKVSIKELVRLNGEKKTRLLLPGKKLVIVVRDPRTLKELRPFLADWERLGSSPEYVVKRPERDYGRPWALTLIRQAVHQVHERFPGTTPVVLGDLSGVVGGRISHHLSHQTGRDVDIGYFTRGNEHLVDFEVVNLDNLDVEKSWALMEAFIRTGRVQYVFMGRELHQAFLDHCTALGYPAEELARLFQSAPGAMDGVIRHWRGHLDHIHVRFACPPDDRLCR